MKLKLLFFIALFCLSVNLNAQPEPCGANPQMTSFCETACVICDIDGFTGVNDLTAMGQGFNEFCTTQFNNMQYIAFIAGTVDLEFQVDVSNCVGGVNSLEVGFFYTDDCENFTAITFCDTDIQSGESVVFNNEDPLIVGQHYYLVIDGSGGANCNWTFTVLQGSTEVSPLSTSGIISYSDDPCVGGNVEFTTTGELGAAQYYWTVDGVSQGGLSQDFMTSFVAPGTYEVCVTAANVCDQAPQSCASVTVREIGSLVIDENICTGESIEVNGAIYDVTGVYQEIVSLPNGCDSIIDIILDVFMNQESNVELWLCEGASFNIGNTAYDQTGIYSDTIPTVAFCDSVVNLDLTIIVCEITGSTTEIPVVCNGTATGTLSFSVDQGTAPFDYTYQNIFDNSISGSGTTDLMNNNSIDNLPIGTYQVYIQDDFGNDVVLLQEITEPSEIIGSFSASDFNGFNISCNMNNGVPGSDGTLSIILKGGVPPFSYQWSNGQSGSEANNLEAGLYEVNVEDASGCIKTFEFEMIAPPLLIPDVYFIDPSCDGFESGMVQVNGSSGGVAPYMYALEGGIFSSDTLYEGLLEGVYELLVQDANSCISLIEAEITAPDIPVISLQEDLEVCLGDSIQINTGINDINIQEIFWNDNQTLDCIDCLDPVAKPFNDTEYILTVISEDGCIDRDSINISVIKKRKFYAPNIFSPDDNGINDHFTIYGSIEVAAIRKLVVFNRWGAVVFETNNIMHSVSELGWDGKFNGEVLNPASFAWMAEISFIDGETISYGGSISLVR